MGAENERPGAPEPTPDRPEKEPAPTAAPQRRGARDRPGKRRGKKGMGAVGLFLLFGAAPAGITIWFLAQPQWRKDEILARVPEGVGGRAINAGIVIAVLIGLARIALPAFHGASGTLQDAMNWIKSRKQPLRAMLFPVEFLIWLVWFVLQLMVAVDAVMIVAACLLSLLLVGRIFKPDLLPQILPQL